MNQVQNDPFRGSQFRHRTTQIKIQYPINKTQRRQKHLSRPVLFSQSVTSYQCKSLMENYHPQDFIIVSSVEPRFVLFIKNYGPKKTCLKLAPSKKTSFKIQVI